MNSWGSYSPAIASDFVKQFEGRELKAYQCSADVWTIGYGHTKGGEGRRRDFASGS